jgi:hypothetical protein
MNASFDYDPIKIWAFSKENKIFDARLNSKEIYDLFISNNPVLLEQYSNFDPKEWGERYQKMLDETEGSSRINEDTAKEEEFPTYYDLKYASLSKIFESEEIRGLTPDQIQEAEKTYYNVVEKLKNGEEIDEGFLGGLAAAGASALIGPSIMRALCRALGISEEGPLGKLLTSKLVLAAVGYTVAR